VEDVVLDAAGDEVVIGIRFRGGMTESVRTNRLLKSHET